MLVPVSPSVYGHNDADKYCRWASWLAEGIADSVVERVTLCQYERKLGVCQSEPNRLCADSLLLFS